MRARTRTRSDTGKISTPLVLAVAGLLLLAILSGAGGGFDQGAAACQAQPDPTRQARNSIPANYLALYRRAGRDSGIAWNLLAAIGKVESDHGRYPGPGVYSGANHAGAAGPMQIGIGGAATNNWGGAPRHRANAKAGGYGVDGNADGWADVYDPADAIPAAARFLKVHGAPTHVRAAIFAYNPSSAYVSKVFHQADLYADHGAQPVNAAAPACGQTAIVHRTDKSRAHDLPEPSRPSW